MTALQYGSEQQYIYNTVRQRERSMESSGPHRHAKTGVLFIFFFIVFFNSPCNAFTTTPHENHTAISTSSNPHSGGCIKRFRVKRNFSDACSTCTETGGELYGIKLITKQPKTYREKIQKIFLTAVNEGKGIWIDAPNKTICEQNEPENCSKALRDTEVKMIPCSSNLEFFCYYKDTLKELSDANCPTITSTATPLTTTTTGKVLVAAPPTSSFIISISICVTASLVLIITVVACCLCRRQRTPAKHAVREASALYHRQNSDVETETGNGPQRMQQDEHDVMENSAYSVFVVTPPRPEVPNETHARPENYDVLGRQEKHYYSALSPRSCDETKLNENIS